jgi:hypothetical protein
MAWGFRVPSHSKTHRCPHVTETTPAPILGTQGLRGWGWITNPRRAAYNRVYSHTTFVLGRGRLVMFLLMVSPLVIAEVSAIRVLWP